VSIDYGEMERQFLETLKADSGRALDEWMAAITAEGLTHRNDIIDWLRRQGFMFSKASWLERIHNNGGKPVYSGASKTRSEKRPETRGETRPEPRPRPSVPPQLRVVVSNQPPPSAAAPSPEPASVAPPSPASPAADGDPAAIDALIARAKAYRPLAAYVIAETRKQVPGVSVLPSDGYLVFRLGSADFALLTINAKELRLGLALKTVPAGAALETAKLPALRGAPSMNHMAVLTDARQITPALLSAIAQAAGGT
jgi:hypothetical protein